MGLLKPPIFKKISDIEVSLGDIAKHANDYVSVKSYGAKGDGVTDDTVAIQNCITANDNVLFPKGNYLITGEITLRSNVNIIGNNATILTSNTRIFIAYSVENTGVSPHTVPEFFHDIKISNLNFENTGSNYGVIAIYFKSANNITVFNCKTKKMGLITVDTAFSGADAWNTTTDPVQTAGIVNENCLSNNIWIYNNYIYGYDDIEIGGVINAGSGKVAAVNGVTLRYCKNAVIDSNIIKWFNDGVRFWGGDVGNSYNQDVMEYYIKNVTVTNNHVENMVMGGIWGGRMKWANFSNNTVKYVGDVGLDFEGCRECEAYNNFVTDANHGTMGTMFSSKFVTFSGNTCRDTGFFSSTWSIVYVHVADMNMEVNTTFENNTFIHDYFLNTSIVAGSYKIHSFVKFKNNLFVNSGLKFNNNWTPRLDIDGNKFHFSVQPTENICYIDKIAGYNGIVLNFSNNIFSAIGNLLISDYYALSLQGRTWSTSPKLIVKNNIIPYTSTEGFSKGIEIKYSTQATNGYNPRYYISNNLVKNITDNSENGIGVVILDNNKTCDTQGNIPNAIPVNSTYGNNYVAGQKIYFDAPDANGYTGAMCTVVGNPGTWKRFGQVEA